MSAEVWGGGEAAGSWGCAAMMGGLAEMGDVEGGRGLAGSEGGSEVRCWMWV